MLIRLGLASDQSRRDSLRGRSGFEACWHESEASDRAPIKEAAQTRWHRRCDFQGLAGGPWWRRTRALAMARAVGRQQRTDPPSSRSARFGEPTGGPPYPRQVLKIMFKGCDRHQHPSNGRPPEITVLMSGVQANGGKK